MKKAILTSWWIPGTKESGYVWETVNEEAISEHSTREDALANRPDGYKCLDDAWQEI